MFLYHVSLPCFVPRFVPPNTRVKEIHPPYSHQPAWLFHGPAWTRIQILPRWRGETRVLAVELLRLCREKEKIDEMSEQNKNMDRNENEEDENISVIFCGVERRTAELKFQRYPWLWRLWLWCRSGRWHYLPPVSSWERHGKRRWVSTCPTSVPSRLIAMARRDGWWAAVSLSWKSARKKHSSPSFFLSSSAQNDEKNTTKWHTTKWYTWKEYRYDLLPEQDEELAHRPWCRWWSGRKGPLFWPSPTISAKKKAKIIIKTKPKGEKKLLEDLAWWKNGYLILQSGIFHTGRGRSFRAC